MSRLWLALVCGLMACVGCASPPDPSAPRVGMRPSPAPSGAPAPSAAPAESSAATVVVAEAEVEDVEKGAPVPATPLPKAPAARLAEVQRRLAAVDDFVGQAIPPAAQPLLVELRQTSVALIREVVSHLAEGGVASLTEAQIETAIAETVTRAGVAAIAPGEEMAGDNGLWMAAATRSKVNPRYLVVGFHFQIPCGSDSGYLVYDRLAKGAEPILVVSAPPSDTIEPLFWNASFALPPPGHPERFFFALTRLTPWCQSALRQMQLLVLAPSGDPLAPRRLIDETHSHHLQKSYRLKVMARQIEWETHDGIQALVLRWRQRGDAFELF